MQELQALGQTCSLSELFLLIDKVVAGLDLELHSAANARLVHDALMMAFCVRDNPPVRPSCIRMLKAPGLLQACSECTDTNCPGNHFLVKEGSTCAVFVHYKTATAHGRVHTIEVQPGSNTELLLGAYMDWARPLLVKSTSSSPYLFLNLRGDVFSESAFNSYLPRLLSAAAPRLSWTKLRHIVATGLVPLASVQELEGIAAACQTSLRKLKEVYQDNAREMALDVGLRLYRSLNAPASPLGASGGAAAEQTAGAEQSLVDEGELHLEEPAPSLEERELLEEAPFVQPPLQLELAQQLELALVPNTGTALQLAPAAVRLPIATLLAKHKAELEATRGACLWLEAWCRLSTNSLPCACLTSCSCCQTSPGTSPGEAPTWQSHELRPTSRPSLSEHRRAGATQQQPFRGQGPARGVRLAVWHANHQHQPGMGQAKADRRRKQEAQSSLGGSSRE